MKALQCDVHVCTFVIILIVYCVCSVIQSCPTLWDPMNCSPPGYSVHGILQARILEWIAMPSSRRSSQPRDRTQVSHIASGFFTVWATRKPKNTGVESLSLFQGIFLTQESSGVLLHCRWILYQLSYQGSPNYLQGRLYGEGVSGF